MGHQADAASHLLGNVCRCVASVSATVGSESRCTLFSAAIYFSVRKFACARRFYYWAIFNKDSANLLPDRIELDETQALEPSQASGASAPSSPTSKADSPDTNGNGQPVVQVDLKDDGAGALSRGSMARRQTRGGDVSDFGKDQVRPQYGGAC